MVMEILEKPHGRSVNTLSFPLIHDHLNISQLQSGIENGINCIEMIGYELPTRMNVRNNDHHESASLEKAEALRVDPLHLL